MNNKLGKYFSKIKKLKNFKNPEVFFLMVNNGKEISKCKNHEKIVST